MLKIQLASGASFMGMLVLVGCQSGLVSGLPPAFELDSVPAALAEPAVFDWSTQRVSGKAIDRRRADHFRRLLAFSASSGWAVGGELVNQWAPIAATDTVCNGAASVYNTSGTPTDVRDSHFLLTQAGKFLRIKKDKTAPSVLDLGRTFSRTYVTLSPAGGRAYLLSDDGRFFVINTATTPMTKVSELNLGVTGNNGIAVTLDPIRSNIADGEDFVYVPTADGKVRKYTVTRGATALVAPTVSAATTYTISTNAFKAPAIVLDGDIFIGDQGGQFFRYDTDSSSATNTFTLGPNRKFNSAPTIHFSGDTPAHVFATVGAACAWMDLSSGGATFSRGLFLDDGENAGTKNGRLLDYDYNNSPADYTLNAAQSLTINAVNQPLETTPGGATPYKYADELIAAQTYNNNPDLYGPVRGYIRWDNSAWALPADKVIQKVELTLRANGSNGNLHWCPPPEMHTTSENLQGGPPTLWSFANMTTANAPTLGPANYATYLGNLTQGCARFQKNQNTTFDLSPAWGATPSDHYSIALTYPDTNPDNVFWPFGGNSAAGPLSNGGPADANKEAVHFENHTTANPPRLKFYVTSASMPTPSIETPAIVDSWNNRVYVFYTNAVYSLNFSSEVAWTDTEFDAANNPTGTKYTYWALTASGDRGLAGARGCTHSGNALFVGNMTAPLLSYDGQSLFTLDRYPTTLTGQNPTVYRYALTKFAVNGGLPTLANSHEFAGHQAAKEAASYLTFDASGANALFGLPNASGSPGQFFSLVI